MKYGQVVLHKKGGRGNTPYFVYIVAVICFFTVFYGHHKQKKLSRSYHDQTISQVTTSIETTTSTTTTAQLSDKQLARQRQMENNLKNPKSWTSILASMEDDVDDEYRR